MSGFRGALARAFGEAITRGRVRVVGRGGERRPGAAPATPAPAAAPAPAPE